MQNLWPAGYGKITHLAGLSCYTIFWQCVLKGVDSERPCFREEREGKTRHCSSSSNWHSVRGTRPWAQLITSYFLWKPKWVTSVPTYRPTPPFSSFGHWLIDQHILIRDDVVKQRQTCDSLSAFFFLKLELPLVLNLADAGQVPARDNVISRTLPRGPFIFLTYRAFFDISTWKKNPQNSASKTKNSQHLTFTVKRHLGEIWHTTSLFPSQSVYER